MRSGIHTRRLEVIDIKPSVPRWQFDATVLLLLAGVFFVGMRVYVLESEKTTQFISPVPPFQVQVIREVKAVEVYPETVDQMIADASKEFGVSKYLLHCILEKESNYRADAVGDSGKAVGMAQFWPATWSGFRKLMGEEISERTNPRQAIRTLAWALKDGRGRNWTPYLDGRCR